ncbi:ParB/RepB/Spo0J family partition protein [Nodularia spumigena CS-584]|jgi:ParB family transcriptional regulator, chromosome partitioning protein|uniref:Chromosome partitioning protein, ParB family n=1 Tax=Nodularia spumigena UHCC 0039 TaxID=1914872 RepID=A0A2S0Q9N0_NODSP|nr:ParB/RepB/Spo0J family partition protein [Nodularia spumigena]AHJ31005.1 Chromosome (plasmid) partitioning protein ParB [Nodularia spumigena CCY9414]AVZ31123.1 chromosome partitioning protein, ParB family [Nodularia spumigena UHCC 0039]EAW44681.1 chromosome partitioning protein, ParB family protein [Nodularia spumigena CCY9414]MDB9382263.1 ParB/RepB/Spo0J family partition protein [Nodularia spumigena CS-584]
MVRKRTEKPFAGQITTPPPAPWLSPVEADTPPAAESKVKLQDIHLPPQQPRRYFDPQALTELIASVKQHGILHPLLVRPLTGGKTAGKYELVAGERRYRAATEAGLEEVPVVVRELSDDQAFQLALIENLQRQDLNPVEETEGILHLLAIRLESDVEAVKSLLYRMKNASSKGEKPLKDSEEQSRRNVSTHSETTDETESPGHVSTDLSDSVSPTENGETTSESSSNFLTHSEITEETQSRRNVSPNSETTDETESGSDVSPKSLLNNETEPGSDVSPNSEIIDATASGKNISPNSGTTTLKKSRKNVSQDANTSVSLTEETKETEPKDEARENISPDSSITEETESTKNVSQDADTSVSLTEESQLKDEARENVSSDSGITEEKESRRNVSPNPDEEKVKKVQEVFESLGMMNWLSFTTKRLPLLNLPLEILTALREGKLEYTKAQALARIKDNALCTQLLDQAIAHNWSLNEIKAQIAANTQSAQPPSAKSPNQIPERLKNVTQSINKRKLWEQPAKQKKLETLLSKLEALLGDES